MFKRILLPLDGSALAERALPTAVALAEASGATLVLLQATSQFTLTAVDPHLYEEMVRLSENQAQAYLRSICLECPAAVPAEHVTVGGDAAAAIVNFAAAQHVDLIVMSSHGRSGLSRWVYGSVAEKTLRQAPCPVVVIRADSDVALTERKRLLVPLDGSELAEKALPPALALAQALAAEIHLLRVTEPAHAALETAAMADVFNEIEQQETQEAEAYLQQKYRQLPNDRLFVAVRHAPKSVAETIIDYAREQQAGLIVMSSHGRSGLQRWVYGSVAEKVLHGACCATMIVPGTEATEKNEANYERPQTA